MGNSFDREMNPGSDYKILKPGVRGQGYRSPVHTTTDDEFFFKYAISRVIGDGCSATVQQATRIGSSNSSSDGGDVSRLGEFGHELGQFWDKVRRQPSRQKSDQSSDVAIKVIRKKGLNRESSQRVMRELETWRRLQHVNIVRLHEVYDTPSSYSFVGDLCERGDLLEYINEHGYFNEAEARPLFKQLVAAVEYCHKSGVVHRDLKLENVLLDRNFNIKIADFGFADFFDTSLTTRMTEWCGSPPYAAPEIFTGQPYYGPEIDVWSMGVVLYALVTGALPFQAPNFDDLTSLVVNGVFSVPFYLSEACIDLLHKMICVDPEQRISLDGMQRHPWANGADAMTAHASQSGPSETHPTLSVVSAGMPSRPDQRTDAKHTATTLTMNRTPEAVTATTNAGTSNSGSDTGAADDITRRKLFDAPSIPDIAAVAVHKSKPEAQPLMLFACTACGTDNSARWDFTLRQPDICLRCRAEATVSARGTSHSTCRVATSCSGAVTTVDSGVELSQ
eukprot:m.734161 g.734161  ORF g.734161 m.734161 type:complete len:506 (+) comp23079_c0_seq2:561-2078(+)